MFRTQVRVGTADQGFDFGSFIETPNGLAVFLNESKGTAAIVPAGRFTSVGMGRGGAAVFERNLGFARDAIREQFEGALQEQLLDAIRNQSTIRLIGPQGFNASETTINAIKNVTHRPVIVGIER